MQFVVCLVVSSMAFVSFYWIRNMHMWHRLNARWFNVAESFKELTVTFRMSMCIEQVCSCVFSCKIWWSMQMMARSFNSNGTRHSERWWQRHEQETYIWGIKWLNIEYWTYIQFPMKQTKRTQWKEEFFQRKRRSISLSLTKIHWGSVGI